MSDPTSRPDPSRPDPRRAEATRPRPTRPDPTRRAQAWSSTGRPKAGLCRVWGGKRRRRWRLAGCLPADYDCPPRIDVRVRLQDSRAAIVIDKGKEVPGMLKDFGLFRDIDRSQ